MVSRMLRKQLTIWFGPSVTALRYAKYFRFCGEFSPIVTEHVPHTFVDVNRRNVHIAMWSRASLFRRRAFSVSGRDVWNSLPTDIRLVDSQPAFLYAH